LRSAIGVDDYDAFAGKAFENAGLNGVEDGLDGFGVVMGGEADEDVDLADVDELAEKIVG